MGQHWMVSGLVDHFRRDYVVIQTILFLIIGGTHGATLARREREPNNPSATQTILFIGDGSLYASFLSQVRYEC